MIELGQYIGGNRSDHRSSEHSVDDIVVVKVCFVSEPSGPTIVFEKGMPHCRYHIGLRVLLIIVSVGSNDKTLFDEVFEEENLLRRIEWTRDICTLHMPLIKWLVENTFEVLRLHKSIHRSWRIHTKRNEGIGIRLDFL